MRWKNSAQPSTSSPDPADLDMKLGWDHSYQFLGQLTFLVNVKTVQEAHVPAEKPILIAVNFATCGKDCKNPI